MDLSTHTVKGVVKGIDKVARYGWTIKDAPGTLTMLHKDVLQVHPAYQRDLIEQKVRQITAEWSWIACGTLIIGKRGGEYWVIDGQHRAMGAKRRSDIQQLPCLVFETESVKQEAQGFLDVNTGRKPITSTGRHKAMVAAGNDTAAFVQSQLDQLGITIRSKAERAGDIKCIGWCMKRASEDRDRFTRVLRLVADMSNNDGIFIAERVLEGVWILDSKCGDGLSDKRLVQRLKDKGAKVLLDAAGRAAAFYSAGGGKVWAEGMLNELNKGLHRKFTFIPSEA